jgi:hypothetical protein
MLYDFTASMRYQQHVTTMEPPTLPYPLEACPFCAITAAYPLPSAPLWSSPRAELAACVPSDEEAAVEKTSPSSFVVLRSRDVVAFLDILPMTVGHLLVTTRRHKVKVADMGDVESREIGELCGVVGGGGVGRCVRGDAWLCAWFSVVVSGAKSE